MVMTLTILIIISLFFDYMLYLHFNTLFEDQFDLTNKLIAKVETPSDKDDTDESQTTLESFTEVK